MDMNGVLTEALVQLTERHRCDYEDIVYALAKKHQCLDKVPFQRSIMALEQT